MKSKLAILLLALPLALVATEKTKVSKTMTVARCQAILRDGKQCPEQASDGETTCWRHRGVAKAVGDTTHDVGKGAQNAWQSTKNWSTNAWESTKSGTSKAWTATKEAFSEAGDEFSKMMRKVFDKDPAVKAKKENSN